MHCNQNAWLNNACNQDAWLKSFNCPRGLDSASHETEDQALLGSRDYKLTGYKTVDVDSAYQPDIVAGICDLSPIEDASCSEIIAGHVLEHIDWSDSFRAMSEFVRVLDRGGVLKLRSRA
jgi:hypothetical protein